MTTFYVCAAIGVLTLCAVSYALGHRDVQIDGWNDGYEFRESECKGKCAK